MTKNDATASALDQVDARRRGFLGKLLATGAAAIALPAMSTVALGADPQEQEGGKGKGGKGKGGKGKGDRPDPAQMAARMIEQFDKDGDNALNAEELTAALTQMFSRRGGAGKGGAGGKGKGGQGGKGKGKGDGGR